MPDEFNGASPVNVTSNLEAAFAAEDAAAQEAIDNLTPTPEVPVEPPADETVAPTDAPAQPPETDEEPPAEGEEAEEEPKADEPEEEDADFKAVSKDAPREFLTDPEKIKEQFPRNSSPELRALVAEYGTAAQRGVELEAAIGGEHFVEPVKKIATGLQTGNHQDTFTGIIEATSSEGLLDVLGQAMHMSFVQGGKWAEQPETAEFGKALTAIVDTAIQERFGSHVTVDRLQRMADLDKFGWLDKIEKWTADGDVPYTEVTELLEAQNDPKYAALIQQREELKQQLEAKATQDKSATAVEDSKIENSFSSTVTTDIGKVLNEVVWEKSILRDVPTDDADMKASKAFFRSRLTAEAIDAFNQSDARSKLLADYKQGKQNTAGFKKSLSEAMNDAILQTREPTSIAAKMLAKVYGTKRNAQLTPPKPNGQPSNTGLPPTPAPVKPAGEPKSKAEVQKTLEEAFIAFG